MKQQRTQNPFDKTDLTPQPPSLRGKGEPDSAVINKFVLVPSPRRRGDRKSTRLNSSHANISYAVFCLKIFERTKPAIEKAVSRPGKTGVFLLYGDCATDEGYPEDKVHSPMKPLAKRVKAAFDYVIVIP